MAKEKEGTEENLEPEVSEKPAKKTGAVSLTVLLGIIFGTIIILILAIRFLFLPYMVENMGGEKHKENEKPKVVVNKNWESEFFAQNEKISQFFETGKITTNPRNSKEFVITNFGIIYFPKDEDQLKELKSEKAKEGKETEAGGNTSLLPQKSYAKMKGAILSVIGSLTIEEIQSRRDSLPSMIKTILKPIFKEKEMFIKDVILQEFIIQE